MCPLCSSSYSSFLFDSSNIHGRHIVNDKESFKIYECNKCKNIFIKGVAVDTDYYKKYYTSDYYHQVAPKSFLNYLLSLLTRFSMKQKEHLILKNVGKRAEIDLLDIGSGDGTFLSKLGNKFIKYGVEISKEGYNVGKKKGLIIFHGDFLNYNFKSLKFDVITMWHVFEHIEKPQKLLKKVSKLLKRGGLFIIAVPNSKSLGFKIGKKFWFHLDSPRHLFLPNKKSLTSALSKSHLNILGTKYEFYDCPLDLFWSVRYSFLKYIIYPLYPFFKFISKETITVISKK